jgi:hypothetical protein
MRASQSYLQIVRSGVGTPAHPIPSNLHCFCAVKVSLDDLELMRACVRLERCRLGLTNDSRIL